jgi:hypothetical protein
MPAGLLSGLRTIAPPRERAFLRSERGRGGGGAEALGVRPAEVDSADDRQQGYEDRGDHTLFQSVGWPCSTALRHTATGVKV